MKGKSDKPFWCVRHTHFALITFIKNKMKIEIYHKLLTIFLVLCPHSVPSGWKDSHIDQEYDC